MNSILLIAYILKTNSYMNNYNKREIYKNSECAYKNTLRSLG